MTKLYALDLETAPIGEFDAKFKQKYALEPFSCGVRSKITSIAVYDGERYVQVKESDDSMHRTPKLLEMLKGQIVVGANTIFDCAYLCKQYGYDAVKDIKWMDVQVLTKFIENGDAHRDAKYSLVECCIRHLQDWDKLAEFVEMKNNKHEAGEDEEYWEARGLWDVEGTWLLADKLLNELPESVKAPYWNTCRCIAPLSRGYITGVDVDHTEIDTLESYVKTELKKGLEELGITSAELSSPKKLSNILFQQWGLTPYSKSEKTGEPSTSAKDLAHILLDSGDERLKKLRVIKKLETMQNKYANSLKKARAYLQVDKIFPQPRIFAAATSRMSYSSALDKTDNYKIALAFHQIPRKAKESKYIKRALKAPKGYGIIYSDFSNQEMRIAAEVTQDETLIKAFREDLSLHSLLAAKFSGESYAAIEGANKTGEPAELCKYRDRAKLTNLSSLFRIGTASLQNKFLEDYDVVETIDNVQYYAKLYKQTYPGIPEYWKDAVIKAKRTGFAEALGGTRYYTAASNFKEESSSINHPIQGSGAEMTYYAIVKISDRFPDFIIMVQVHDALYWFVPCDSEEDLKAKAMEYDKFVNSIDYRKLFRRELSVEFKADVKYGFNFEELVSI